ncbi:MAG: hypothetical protein ACKVPX_03740 [Myxococcaceae bacterium]
MFTRILLLAVLFVGSAQAQTIVFQNGWEGNASPGCDFAKLSDNSAWNDYGPGSTCSVTPPVAEIVNNERFAGNASVKVNFLPDGSGNGPDFRIIRHLGQNHTEIYARWYVKWSNNWVFAGGDHKVAIFGFGNQATQDIYYNIRGNADRSGRVTIHSIPADTALSDRSFRVTPGVWHLCEIHIVSGPNGRVEAKMDGQLLNLTTEAGNTVSANNLNTGSGVGYIKLDTTYNIYSFPSSLGLTMATWYDDVAVATGGWIGGPLPSGGGSDGGTSPAAPSAPTRLRVVP